MRPQSSRLSFVLLLAASCLILVCLLVIKPQIEKIIDLKGQIAANRQKLSLLTDKLDTLKRLSDSDLKEKTKRLIQLLPAQNDPANLLAVFRLAAQENQVTLGEIKATPGEISTASASAAKKASFESSFNLTVEGELTQVKNFIGTWATTPPLIKVEAELSQDAKSKLTKAVLLITAYYLPLPEKIDSIDKPLPLVTAREEEILTQIAGFRDLPVNYETLPAMQTGKTNPFSF
jgi:Tfp pilus assembly protein PilO